MNDHKSGAECGSLPEDAVGIIVHDSRPVPAKPRAVAFVYGYDESAQPSLPFGRWKHGEKAA
ncbi:MAG: hypothetical protein LBG44_05165 [Gemmatimonadota bacterium]|jgi:hypothetical protein|nr:hypothetical protein [Gemmatimonadota bacterium]